MGDNDLTLDQVKEIAKALDSVADDLPWADSLFLTAMGKKFADIRDEFKRELGLDEKTAKDKKLDKERYALKTGQQEVFVSVYNAQGRNMMSWLRVVMNLVNQSVSRPIYSTEKAVKEMIRSKSHLNNEGYVCVHISQADLIQPNEERVPRDKVGNVLLLLRERSITKDRLRTFYHKSGIYEIRNGLFNRIGDMIYSEDEA